MNGSATIFPRGSFALKLRKLPRATIDASVQEAAGLLSIGDLLARKPKQLSGGQRQRVALGRAIVRHPQVFLFDEPLSNLQGGSVSFRRDVESFLDADAIRAVPVPDRRELPPDVRMNLWAVRGTTGVGVGVDSLGTHRITRLRFRKLELSTGRDRRIYVAAHHSQPR